MSKRESSRSAPEVWRRMTKSLEEDALDAELPIEEVDAELRAFGVDPDEVGRRGAALAKALLEKRRLAWHAESDANLARARELYASALRPVPPAPRDVLMRRIERRRRGLGDQVAVAAFRKRGAEEASADELVAMIEDLDALRALAGLPAVDDDEEGGEGSEGGQGGTGGEGGGA